MLRRSSAALAIALWLGVLAGCSRSGDKPAADAGARSIAAVWGGILAERDKVHAILVKELESVSHEDCAALGASARHLDDLFTQLISLLGARNTGDPARMRSLGDAITRASSVIQKVRDSALNESPGAFSGLRYPVDRSLGDIERFLTPEEVASGSLLSRPDYEKAPPPDAYSPI